MFEHPRRHLASLDNTDQLQVAKLLKHAVMVTVAWKSDATRLYGEEHRGIKIIGLYAALFLVIPTSIIFTYLYLPFTTRQFTATTIPNARLLP